MSDDDQAEWLLMVDGAARAILGESGCGAVICDETGAVVKELSRYLGCATNNEAEYEGLLMGLEALTQLGCKKIRVQSDSQSLVRQLNGTYGMKTRNSSCYTSGRWPCCASLTAIVSSMLTAR